MEGVFTLQDHRWVLKGFSNKDLVLWMLYYMSDTGRNKS